MTFDSKGYELTFVQKRAIRDKSAHRFTFVYKFFSPITKYIYILNADYHDSDVFAIKFYVKHHRKSNHKYSIITNKGDVANILITCAKIVPILLKDYENASFSIAGSRSIDKCSKKVEDFTENQRFRIYRILASELFGAITFSHFEYPRLSAYLLVNNNCENITVKENEIVKMFSETYNELLDVV